MSRLPFGARSDKDNKDIAHEAIAAVVGDYTTEEVISGFCYAIKQLAEEFPDPAWVVDAAVELLQETA